MFCLVAVGGHGVINTAGTTEVPAATLMHCTTALLWHVFVEGSNTWPAGVYCQWASPQQQLRFARLALAACGLAAGRLQLLPKQ